MSLQQTTIGVRVANADGACAWSLPEAELDGGTDVNVLVRHAQTAARQPGLPSRPRPAPLDADPTDVPTRCQVEAMLTSAAIAHATERVGLIPFISAPPPRPTPSPDS